MDSRTNHYPPPLWVTDRRNTDSLKWSRYRHTDILPMWVADMDCQSAEPIIAALHKRVAQGVFGYSETPEGATQAVIDWIESRHRWRIEPDWIVWVQGLVSALHIVCRAFAKEGEQVLALTPVYPPFLSAPPHCSRRLVTYPLQNDRGYYTIDFNALQNMLTDKTKVLLLCSPHNPVGRLWTKDELLQLTEICMEREILLCSDEIHCDLVLEPTARHIPTATLSKDVENRIITLMSPAKTFNLPGLNCGFAIIPNEKLRRQFRQNANGIVSHINVFGYTACQAAFTEGLPWLQGVLDYLRGNHRLLHEAINRIPGLSMGTVQASYLAWIDVRELNMANAVVFFEQAGVGVMDGAEFGQPGFVRLNFACAQDTLLAAIERIQKAVAER
ncbi:MAG: PatB family C-S lyase [Planctomycetales bacterium]|nr:PatB family C-S lyase [Planctomycetales bacterium]